MRASASGEAGRWSVDLDVVQGGTPYRFLTTVSIETEKGEQCELVNVTTSPERLTLRTASRPLRVTFNSGNDIPVRRSDCYTFANLFDDFKSATIVYGTARQVEANRPDVVGLSGLLTTSHAPMREAVRLIRASLPPERQPRGIIIGGAAVNEQVRQFVGADYSATDAMHGVRLCPGSSRLELKVRAYNRTPFPQTFLWWANVATRVHEAYQSFFPPDVYYVADHARRAMSGYPLCTGTYYGVDYAARARTGLAEHERPAQFVPPHCRADEPDMSGRTKKTVPQGQSGALGTARPATEGSCPDYAPNDLSRYANISTPCSYMCMGSKEDFFGGYDYRNRAGLVHIANHHLAPGKKQWTWGNHAFGYAWDRNLTEADETGEYGPYIELMAGVFTDNQPDFSFLHPYETRVFSQFWYPVQQIGAMKNANLRAAVNLETADGQATTEAPITITVQEARKTTIPSQAVASCGDRRGQSTNAHAAADGSAPCGQASTMQRPRRHCSSAATSAAPVRAPAPAGQSRRMKSY